MIGNKRNCLINLAINIDCNLFRLVYNKKVANFDLGVASNMNKEEFLVKHDFKIKTFDDVYKAVGIIIQISQYLEQEYRQYAKLINFTFLDKTMV